MDFDALKSDLMDTQKLELVDLVKAVFLELQSRIEALEAR